MRFVFPSAVYAQQARAFIQELAAHGECHGVARLDQYLRESSYEAWVAKVIRDVDIANPQEGFVPGFTYFYVDEESDEIIGIISIRLYLNDFLREQGGHIGYSIRPSARRRGHATNMLRAALEFLAPLGITDVLLTCAKDNVASAKVIQNCGGVLENEIYSEMFGRITQRYWIKN